MTRVLGAERVPGRLHDHHRGVRRLPARRRAPGGARGGGRRGARAARGRGRQAARRPGDPLLVSVRSGARVSMPGMLDTVLNLGLGDEAVAGLASATADARFAWDSYRRLLQMFGNVVRGLAVERVRGRARRGARRGRGEASTRSSRPRTSSASASASRRSSPTPATRSPRIPASSCARRSSPCSSPGTAGGRAPTAASSASPTTGAPRSTCSGWRSATAARPRARGSRSRATRPPARPSPPATSSPTRRARTWSPGSATPRALDGLARPAARGPRRAARGARDARAPLRRHAGRRVHGRGRQAVPAADARRQAPGPGLGALCLRRGGRGDARPRGGDRDDRRRLARAAPAPDLRPRRRVHASSPAASRPRPGAAQGAIVFTADGGRAPRRRRRGRDPRPALHRGRGRRRLSRRPRDPHRRGRQVLARRAGRPRDGQAVRRRRLGARDRRRRRESSGWARRSSAPATGSRSTARAGWSPRTRSS